MKGKPRIQSQLARIDIAISARYDHDTFQFQLAKKNVAEIENKILALRTIISDLATGPNDTCQNAPVAIKHIGWLKAQIKLLNFELASARADLEEAREKLQKSTAKAEIVSRLRD